MFFSRLNPFDSESHSAGDFSDAILPVLVGAKRSSQSGGHLRLREAHPESGLSEFGVNHLVAS